MGQLSPTGWVAQYRPGEDIPRFIELPVEKFSDDGEALVVDRKSGALVLARGQSGFVGLSECDRWLSVVPSPPGWRVTGKDAADGTEWSEPVVAWLVNDFGTGQPLIADWECGELDTARNLSTEYTLSGPDEPNPSPQVTESVEEG